MMRPDGAAAVRRGGAGAGLARLALALGAVACIVPLLSAANLERLPAAVPAALAGLLALALCSPQLGLAVTAAAAPLAAWTVRTADLHALRLAEALVLAALAGTLLRLALERRADTNAPAAAWPAGVGPAAAALAAVAGASAAVELGLLQAGTPLTWPAAGAAAAGRVATDYLYGSTAIVPGLKEAARLIEGAALVLVILAWRRRRPALPRRLALATLAGAAAAAAVNFGALAAETLAAERPGALLLSYLGGRRLAVHVADFNASGSYFLMAALVGLGLTLREPAARTARAYGLATLAAGAACWLAGSRTALAAALLAAFAAAAWRLPSCSASGRRRALAGLAAAALVTVPLAMLAAFPERTRHARGSGVGAAWEMAARSVSYRVGIVDAGLRAWSTAPLLGVGAGRYYDLSGQFAEPDLPARFRRENAHNNFLQVAAELGAAGLAAFLGLLAAGGCRVWRAARSTAAREPLLAGAGAGAAAFLVTCLAGHPLLVAEAAYPFWIVFGLLLALAHGRLPAARAPARRPILTPAIVLIVAATVPLRVAAAARGMTFDDTPAAVDVLRSGLFDWELEHATGRRFRWTGAHATTFVPGAAQTVRIVLRALHAGPDGGPVVVDVALGGRPVRRVSLFDRRWVEVTLHPVPGHPAAALQRIDLRVTPPWKARERRNGDARTLGVQIRELAVTRAPAG